MDLLEYWNVVKRRRLIIVVGILLTTALAMLALLRYSSDGITYRSPATYVGESTIFVTQQGFPYGRTALTEYVKAIGAGDDTAAVPRFADPGRMEYLASLYSELAASDEVRRLVGKPGDEADFDAATVNGPDGRSLPLIRVRGFSTSPAEAVATTNRATSALRTYIRANQEASDIADDTRVQLPIITRAETAKVFEGVRYTSSLMLLILGLALTTLVAFARDNIVRARAGSSPAAENVAEPERLERATSIQTDVPGQRAKLRRSSGG